MQLKQRELSENYPLYLLFLKLAEGADFHELCSTRYFGLEPGIRCILRERPVLAEKVNY